VILYRYGLIKRTAGHENYFLYIFWSTVTIIGILRPYIAVQSINSYTVNSLGSYKPIREERDKIRRREISKHRDFHSSTYNVKVYRVIHQTYSCPFFPLNMVKLFKFWFLEFLNIGTYRQYFNNSCDFLVILELLFILFIMSIIV